MCSYVFQAVTRFTAVTRGGGYRFEHEYIAGLKDRDLARAIVNSVSICDRIGMTMIQLQR